MLLKAALLITLLLLPMQVLAGSYTSGQTHDFDGSIRLMTSGNAFIFADGTSQTTAAYSDGSAIWGQITGLIENQTDLSNAMANKADLDQYGKIYLSQIPVLYSSSSAKPSIEGYTPTWQTQGNQWVVLPEFTVSVDSLQSAQYRITYTDNIGIDGPVWCNVGIFLHEEITPLCSFSWSGNPLTSSFSHHSVTCMSTLLLPPINGQYVFTVKHRSAKCAYGNYAFDTNGGTRQLLVEGIR